MNETNLPKEQSGEEWLKWRSTRIGSSDIPIIMDVSPYKTPYQLWLEKTGRSPGQEDNFAMAQGREYEPILRLKVEDKLQKKLEPLNVAHPEVDYFIASLDCWNEDGTLVELKTGGEELINSLINGDLREDYMMQLQWQMMVKGLVSALVFAENPKTESEAMWGFKRNTKTWEEMTKKAHEFHEYIVTDTPPPLTARDCIDCSEDEFVGTAEMYLELKKELEEKEKTLKVLEKTLRGYVPKDSHSVKGGGIKVTGFWRAGNVDYKKIPELESVDLEQYRKGSSWQTRITKL